MNSKSLAVLGLAVATIIIFIGMAHQSSQCRKHGGIEVRGAWGPVCLKGEAVLP